MLSTGAQNPPDSAGVPEALPAGQEGSPQAGQPNQAPAGYVSEERFNGLMSAYQSLLTQQRVGQSQGGSPAAPQPQGQGQPAQAPAATAPPPQQGEGTPDLEQLVQMLVYERQVDRYTAAVQAAVAAHPEVAPFQDRLQGDTPEAIMEDARKLAESLHGGQPAPAPTDGGQPPTPGQPAEPGTPSPTSTPIVPGGAPGQPATPPPDPQAQFRAIMTEKGVPAAVRMDRYLKFKRENPDFSAFGEAYSSWDNPAARRNQ